MFNPSESFTATVTIKSPMGPIKAFVNIDPVDATHFTGNAKLMGKEAPITGGLRNGSSFVGDISLMLPFGKANIRIEVAIDENGTIKGEAIMPHRKGMTITGSVDA